MPCPTIFYPRDLLAWVDSCCGTVNRRLAIEALVCTTLWIIWRYRNDLVHDSHKMMKDILVDSIKEFSFLWFSNRSKKVSITWNIWF